jgi:hypothetical protein
MKKINALLVVTCICFLSACAQFVAVGSAETTIRNAVSVKLAGASKWNKYAGGGSLPYEYWTAEGFVIDQLRFYPGIAVGEPIAVLPSGAKETDKKAVSVLPNMQAEQIADVVEAAFSLQQTQFKRIKLSPAQAFGQNGIRFEFSFIPKESEVEYVGIAYGAMKNSKLYLSTYHAAKTHYFKKHSAAAESIMQSAQLKS